MSGRRVVVTGMGAVTPFGVGVTPFWDGLLDGRSGVRRITSFDASRHDVRIAGEGPGFDAARYLDRKTTKRLDRYAQFALVAADEAFQQSGLKLEDEDPCRIATIHGTGIGGLNELEEQAARLREKGPSKVSAFTIPKLMVNAAAGNISIRYGLKGNSIAIGSACASATHAMGEALNHIRRGDTDVVFTGGSEAAVTPLALAAFASMKALSPCEEPTQASRPFDRDRAGFVLAEGGGGFVFEEYDRARQRGATLFAEVVGFGASSDADHITQPAGTGVGAATAMKRAIDDAHLPLDSIDYINAHGTGTPLGDIAETRAIKAVFGRQAAKLVVSSTKSAVGHALGGSGGMELVAAIQAMRQSVIPPTINLEVPGEGCDLDYCPLTARDARVDVAMSNSFGFGGHNACLVIKRIA